MSTVSSENFAFGRNWQRYVERYLSPDRIDAARVSLVDILETDLHGRRFLDIGAGSGLFSLAARGLGARPVVSVDVDADSVACCTRLRKDDPKPSEWEVLHGSILDDGLVASLEPADVVYSWGALHHTGDMYTAIRNAASLVAPDGILCIAIYNRVRGPWVNSERWALIKRTYNRSPPLTKAAMRIGHRAYWTGHQVKEAAHEIRAGSGLQGVRRRRAPLRAMARSTDLEDWLGGYPYEYATAEEIVEFCERACGLTMRKLVAVRPDQVGNHQFVFHRA